MSEGKRTEVEESSRTAHTALKKRAPQPRALSAGGSVYFERLHEWENKKYRL